MSAISKGNVLILSTYPIAEPRHGGQLRVQNMKRAYEAAGWLVTSVAIYPEEAYPIPQIGPRDIPFPVGSPYRLFAGQRIPLVDDLTSGRFAAAPDGGFKQVLAAVTAPIDVIQVEQPWLWPLAVKLRERPEFASCLLVYSSQNIEAPLKADILKPYGGVALDTIVSTIDALERQATREANLVLAVTDGEADELRRWGGRKVVVAPNGIEPWMAEDGVLQPWKGRLPKAPWLLYVASAHPPNFIHFAEIFGGALGCFSPSSRLVVAGGVCEHLARAIAATRWHALNASRIQLLFELTDKDLSAVKSLAHGFVLPIPFGGGSNIKTAEAIYSGKYVVGTPAAFRGYEAYLDFPEIRVGHDAAGLRAAVRDVTTRPSVCVASDSAGFEKRQRLRWSKSLEQVPEIVDALCRDRSARG
ncbi:MAG: glycosyltransferase family 4 protein [Rhizobiales bacterium]|nr:glycosyltransferase family 4 protein [Hyphomicrobiales bacterium]